MVHQDWIMEFSLKALFESNEVTIETMKILVEEEILNSSIFTDLKDEHFHLLLPEFKVGQHAMLINLQGLHEVSYYSVLIAFFTCTLIQFSLCIKVGCQHCPQVPLL